LHLQKSHKNNSCIISTSFFNSKDLLSIFPTKLIQHANTTTTKFFVFQDYRHQLFTFIFQHLSSHSSKSFFCLPTLNFSSSSLNKAISILGFGVLMHLKHISSNYVSITYQLCFVGLNALPKYWYVAKFEVLIEFVFWILGDFLKKFCKVVIIT